MTVQYAIFVDWNQSGSFLAGTPTGAQATATSTSTSQYLTCSNADASDVNVGDNVMLFTSGDALRSERVYTVSQKVVVGSNTQIWTYPSLPVTVSLTDVLKVVTVNGKDVTMRRSVSLTASYGRASARATDNTSSGEASFGLNNNSGDYYYQKTTSP